jgi:molybdopterin-guanine dinucleotide biosynthesis protein A
MMIMNKKIAAAVLAGGQASRYHGKEKGIIEISPGVSIVDHIISEIRQAGIDEIVISANRKDSYLKFGLPVISDRFKNKGPLGGIESALSYFAGRFDGVFFLPCDMPFISRKEIGVIKNTFLSEEAKIVTAETGHFFWQPLCSVVHIDFHPEIEKAFVEDCLGTRSLWEKLGAKVVHFDNEERFVNINSQKDLENFLKRKHGKNRG